VSGQEPGHLANGPDRGLQDNARPDRDLRVNTQASFPVGQDNVPLDIGLRDRDLPCIVPRDIGLRGRHIHQGHRGRRIIIGLRDRPTIPIIITGIIIPAVIVIIVHRATGGDGQRQPF
jgi:hypothetical protein